MKNIIWRSRAAAWLGLVIVLVPFSGLPENFKNIIFVVLGLLIALFGFAKSHYAAGYEKEYKEAVVDSMNGNFRSDDLSDQVGEDE